MWRLGLSAALLASACQYDRPPDVMAIDATPVDAPPPCTPSTTVCDDAAGVYIECDAGGSVVRQLTCPLGCATDTEQCLDIDPHNGLAMYLDMVAAPPDLLATGPIVIDSTNGTIAEAGVARSVPSFLSPGGLRVFVVNDLRAASTVDVVRAPGAPGIAVLASGTIIIEGVVDVSANGDVAGPGGAAPASSDSDCTMFDFFSPSPQGIHGLGGGGGYALGGAGGSAFAGTVGPPGPVHPLGTGNFGGCAGGTYFESSPTVIGGAGGGGLQLVSRRSITLTAGATLDASGGGGHATLANRPGAGGGAGGILLLEAPTITLDGPRVVLSVKGGGGGGAGNATLRGGNGGEGGTDAMPAAGGWTPATGGGGTGGLAGGGEGGLTGLASEHHGGGGGGSAGFIATFSASGTTAPTNGAALRGPHIDGRLGTRHVP